MVIGIDSCCSEPDKFNHNFTTAEQAFNVDAHFRDAVLSS